MHFTAENSWLNDPNGLIYLDGEYHLFFQNNPSGLGWGNMSWGHAVSTDLVHWRRLPVALPATDTEMAFSGSVVYDRQNTSGLGTPDRPALIAVYTAYNPNTHRQSQALAYSLDAGRTFTRYHGNPVIDLGSTEFRDPKVFWHEQTSSWVMVVALPTQHKVSIYTSPNLRSWTHRSDFGPAGSTGGVWECPDLFALPVDGDAARTRWVLLVSMNPGGYSGGSGTQYFIGDFDGARFQADPLPSAAPSRNLANFEGSDWQGWSSTGTAFGNAPVSAALPGQSAVTGFVGAKYASSFHGGDAATGTLTSAPFTIDRDYLNFSIGGGDHPLVGGPTTSSIPPGRTLADFEGPTLDAGWTGTDGLTSVSPASGALATQQPVSGFEGGGLLNTYLDGDRTTGTVRSPDFTIDSKFLNLLVGGGRHPWGQANPTAVNLVVDNVVVASVTGSDDERLNWRTFAVDHLRGRTARLEVVDHNSAGWGHILLDQVTASDVAAPSRAQGVGVELVVDSTARRSTSATNSEGLDSRSWYVRDLRGKTARLVARDQSTGSWGHLSLDEVSLSDRPQGEGRDRLTRWFDYGPDNYASVTFNDAPGRRVAIGWMSNWDYATATPSQTWRGAMTLPRELKLRTIAGQVQLTQAPVTEVNRLRAPAVLSNATVQLSGNSVALPSAGESFEVNATLTPGTADRTWLDLVTAAGIISVEYDRQTARVLLDRAQGGRRDFHPAFPSVSSVPVRPATDGSIALRLIVDSSSIEIFTATGDRALTAITFGDGPPSLHARADGGARLSNVTIRPLNSATQ